MKVLFDIKSSDPVLLEKAGRLAEEFVQPYMIDDVVGIVFLGAIVRGYFDSSADIDIAFFKKQASTMALPNKFLQFEGMDVHCWWLDYESELITSWDMSKRWTYSQGQICYDPANKIAQLLAEKVPLRPEEKKWLMMSGLTLSEWYGNRLTRLWVERGNMISAHHMFNQGLLYFFDMLFGLNDQLVPDMKWRYYCAERLARIPANFKERIRDTMILYAISLEELERRRKAFMEMWEEMKPVIEKEVQMSFDEMVQIV